MDPYHRYASLLRVLANPGRLNLLDLLMDRELTLPEIQEWVEMDFATLSRHLALLKQAGLVRERRTGRVAHFCAESEVVTALFDLLDLAGHLSQGQSQCSDAVMR